MQAKVAPAAGGCDERGSEFIAEAQRRHDVAISGAGMAITASGCVERRHMAGASGQRLKLVHIVMAELIVNELIGHIDEWIFGERAGEQQRSRVCRGEEDGVDRKQRMDGPHYFCLKRRAAQS